MNSVGDTTRTGWLPLCACTAPRKALRVQVVCRWLTRHHRRPHATITTSTTDDWTLGYVTELPYSINHFPETRSRAHALNSALLKRLHAGERLSGLVSPAHSAGIAIAYHDQLFLAAQQIGESNTDALASYAQAVLQISTGSTATSAALPELQREARNFLNYGDEYYRSLDLFSAA